MLEPPARKLPDGSDGPLYDSLVAAGGRIVVSCHRDYQAYAEHVITFRTTSGCDHRLLPYHQHQQRVLNSRVQYYASLGPAVQMVVDNQTAGTVCVTDFEYQTAGGSLLLSAPPHSVAAASCCYIIAANSKQTIWPLQNQRLQVQAVVGNNPAGPPLDFKVVNPLPAPSHVALWIVGATKPSPASPPKHLPQQLKFSIPPNGLPVEITAMAGGPNSTVCTGHADGSVRIMDVQTATVVATLPHHQPAPVTAVACSDSWLVWSYDSGAVIAQKAGASRRLVVRPSSKNINADRKPCSTTVQSLVFPRRAAGLTTPVLVIGSNDGCLTAYQLDDTKGTAQQKLKIGLYELAIAESGVASGVVVEMRRCGSEELLGAATPGRVFAVCALAACSVSDAAKKSKGKQKLPRLGCAICAWDLNKADRMEMKLIPNVGALPIGLQWHSGKLFAMTSDGSVICFAPGLTVAQTVRLWRLKNASLISSVAFGHRNMAASTTDKQIVVVDTLPALQPPDSAGRWVLEGQINGAGSSSKYSYHTHDIVTHSPLGVRINSSGVVNDGVTKFVSQGTVTATASAAGGANTVSAKAEWVSCMPGNLPARVTADYIAFHNPGVVDGTPCGLQANRVVGNWEIVNLEQLSTAQLSFFYEAHVGFEVAGKQFTPHQIFFPRDSTVGGPSGAATSVRTCQRVLLGDLQYPPATGAFCDACKARIEPDWHFFHDGPLTGAANSHSVPSPAGKRH